MFLVTNSTYPLTSGDQMTEKFQKAPALPSFLKRMHMLTTAGDEGIVILGIYQLDDDKVADGIRALTKYYVQYHDVEGFRYTVETMLAVEEAIPLTRR